MRREVQLRARAGPADGAGDDARLRHRRGHGRDHRRARHQNSAKRDVARERAFTLAEAGLNNALSILSNAADPSSPSALSRRFHVDERRDRGLVGDAFRVDLDADRYRHHGEPGRRRRHSAAHGVGRRARERHERRLAVPLRRQRGRLHEHLEQRNDLGTRVLARRPVHQQQRTPDRQPRSGRRERHDREQRLDRLRRKPGRRGQPRELREPGACLLGGRPGLRDHALADDAGAHQADHRSGGGLRERGARPQPRLHGRCRPRGVRQRRDDEQEPGVVQPHFGRLLRLPVLAERARWSAS